MKILLSKYQVFLLHFKYSYERDIVNNRYVKAYLIGESLLCCQKSETNIILLSTFRRL